VGLAAVAAASPVVGSTVKESNDAGVSERLWNALLVTLNCKATVSEP